MNKLRILGLIRHLLTFAGGYFVASGKLDEGTVNEATAAGVTLIGVIWSLIAPEKSST
jgi:hypothetical protein